METQETDQAVSDLSARQASVDSTTANVHRLEQLQSFEKVYAPFAGVITARNTDVGALINAGAAGVPQELFHMAAVSRLRVYVAVPEIDSQAAYTYNRGIFVVRGTAARGNLAFGSVLLRHCSSQHVPV